MTEFIYVQFQFISNFLLSYISNPWEIIGIFALIFNVLSYLEKNDRKMFILLSICSGFYSIHFLWLWLLTASLINLFDVWKNLAVLKYKKNNYLFLVFATIYTIIWIKTWNWILSYLFTAWSILSLYSAFYFRWISLRIVYLLVTIIYLVYSIDWNSISWSLTALLFIIMLSISIFSLYKRRWFLWKVRYYRFLFLKNTRKLLGYRIRRFKFLR